MIALYLITAKEEKMINPLLTSDTENFIAGSSNLAFFRQRVIKIGNGVLLYCTDGEAEITIDLQKYHIVPYTHIILLPGSILSLLSCSEDFRVIYLAFTGEMMRIACFRLEPAFMHFLKDVSCYTHIRPEEIIAIQGIIKAGIAIYADKENQFRNSIAQNLLQIFFLNTYDKVQRFFTKEQRDGNSRKSQLFKKFIRLVHTYCPTQRDVTFYASELCISTRYLSSITQAMAHISAKEIIDKFMILEIKVALQSTNLSLKEIAERYHFPDQSFFGRYFKKHTSISPKEFREKNI